MKAAPKLALFAAAAAFLCGCNDGETPGEKLDKALDKTGDAVKKAGEEIKPHR